MKVSRRDFIGAAGITAVATLATRPFLSLARSVVAAQTAPRYNIITIITDDQDSNSLGVMRHLMSFPRGSWINFSNAICNDGLCAPSRASYLTGLYTHHHGVIRNGAQKQLDDSQTLPVWLKDAGYHTALFGKYLWNYNTLGHIPPGWDVYQELDHGPSGLAASVSGYATEFIRTTTEPFYLHLAPRDPHIPATPQAQYAATDVWLPPAPPSFDEDISDKVSWVQIAGQSPDTTVDWPLERRKAHQALLGVDDMVLAIIGALEQRGILDNTVICYLSDNGFLWGEHRLLRKHWHYEEVIRIPLLIRYPGLVGNREESLVVRIIDLAKTFTEIAGTLPGRSTDGRSLRTIIESPASEWHEATLLERYPDSGGDFSFTGVRVAGWSYVEFHNGEKEMYDLTADPYQLDNLAGQAGYETIQAELQAQMAALLGVDPQPTATATPTATPSPTATPTEPTATPTPVLDDCVIPIPMNAILNPSFEQGKRYWVFKTDASGRFAITRQNPYHCARAGQITILSLGTGVHLFQKDVRLTPSAAYRLTLAARSTTGRNVRISLFKQSDPGVNYGLAAVELPLSPEWNEFMIDFTTTGFARQVKNGRLDISMSDSNVPGEVYYFDGVSLIPLPSAPAATPQVITSVTVRS